MFATDSIFQKLDICQITPLIAVLKVIVLIEIPPALKIRIFCGLNSQVHVSKSSSVPDHCRPFALSDPKDPAYQSVCEHDHNDACDRCDLLSETLLQIEVGLAAQTENLSCVEKEDLLFRVKQAKKAIWAWKSHLLRSVNQDSARMELGTR